MAIIIFLAMLMIIFLGVDFKEIESSGVAPFLNVTSNVMYSEWFFMVLSVIGAVVVISYKNRKNKRRAAWWATFVSYIPIGASLFIFTYMAYGKSFIASGVISYFQVFAISMIVIAFSFGAANRLIGNKRNYIQRNSPMAGISANISK